MRKLLSTLVIVGALVGAISLFAPSGTWDKLSWTPIAEAQAFPSVNQNTVIAWAPVTGATRYEIHAQTGAGAAIGTWVDKGSVLELPVSEWLSGQPLDADYQLFVRGANDDETGPASAPLNVRLVGLLTAPVPTIQ